MTESIQLGAITLTGEHRGSLVAVRIGDDSDTCDVFVTSAEWQSILAIADTKRAADREIERLRDELAKERAVRARLDMTRKWLDEKVHESDGVAREMAMFAQGLLRRVVEGPDKEPTNG